MGCWVGRCSPSPDGPLEHRCWAWGRGCVTGSHRLPKPKRTPDGTGLTSLRGRGGSSVVVRGEQSLGWHTGCRFKWNLFFNVYF